MTLNLDRFQIMMEEIGPSLDEIEAVIQSEECNWAIQFDDQTIITLEWADKPDRIVLSSVLGIPSQETQLSVYETLLCYNLLWKDTGGVKMALAGPDGELILLYEMYAAGLNISELQTILLNFINISSAWRIFVTEDKNININIQADPINMLHLGA